MCDINEIKEAIDELKEKLDDLCDSIEDTVESAVQDAVEDAVEGAVQDAVDDAMQNIDMGGAGGAVMYVLSQDGKQLVPFVSAQAYRIKKGEEPYAISVSGGNMQINDGCDTENYEEVIICSPVWVFTVAAPIKAFCKNKRGRIKSHSIILCHYMNAKFKKAADKIDGLIGNRRRSFKSVPCKEGKFSIVYKESL